MKPIHPLKAATRLSSRLVIPARCLHRTTLTHQQQSHGLSPKPSVVDGASEISHSHFISSASPHSDFNPTQSPSAGVETAHKWEGKLSPTTSHLFKLILPLPKSQSTSSPQPTAFLLHPSQPLSHLSRLIAGSLPPQSRDVEITYLALTGQESDLDTHLRNAEEEEEELEEHGERREGGPFLNERNKAEGRWQEVSWSQSTDLADFIKQSCLNEKFTILIKPAKADQGLKGEMKLEVVIPSFDSRTRYLRKRLLSLTQELDGMTKKKKTIDVQAHQGARKLLVAGLVVGVGYWITVVRYTFWTDAGWDLMEPVTWTVGFGGLLSSAAFLAYHNREVSYSSILDLSVTARQRSLYEQRGLDIDRWTEMVAEAKTIRREIIRIAADYDIEWKGELENLAASARRPIAERDGGGRPSSVGQGQEEGEGEKEKKLDIDKTIDEADELASRSEEQRNKEKSAQRKGQVIDNDTGKSKKSSEEIGQDKGKKLAEK